MLRIHAIFSVLASVVSISGAFALDFPVHRSIQAAEIASLQSPVFDPASFEGIVRLSGCSGALVRFETNHNPQNPAVMMTNGHCVAESNFIPAGTAIANIRSRQTFRLFDANMNSHTVSATRLIYGTMTGSDFSLYELSMTYQEIEDQLQIRPFLISAAHPMAGTQTQILSGYWRTQYDCSIDGFVYELHEADWVMQDSIRYNDGCNTIHGTSGSPILEMGTRTIIGINNTGNDDGEQCTMDNPCEVAADGTITVLLHRSYGQQTYLLNECIGDNGRFDPAYPTCRLIRP